ncbi:entericidin EcnA/B family protein [Asticcacaulis biprosthecium C19]|uniref:Entericidin EcnA/B family protein n=1 Tax=Asticcacaulis biprosthecium C19 TaxID=715226 RepID=F4QLK2_9CAUL|nr:entericidin A/B family lipoprotein [Asticcacaulis biprosthecium]EGF93500.1 entericidin EcnA/B family protein [Asticcacaulis biprosthecium C19]
MKRFFLISCAILFPLSVSACNTIHGAGEDVEAAGEAVQDAAQ